MIRIVQKVKSTHRVPREFQFIYLSFIAVGLCMMGAVYYGKNTYKGQDMVSLGLMVGGGIMGILCIWGIVRANKRSASFLRVTEENTGIKVVVTTREELFTIQPPFRWTFWTGEEIMQGNHSETRISVQNILLIAENGEWIGFRFTMRQHELDPEWPYFYQPLKDAKNVFKSTAAIPEFLRLLEEKHMQEYDKKLNYMPYTRLLVR